MSSPRGEMEKGQSFLESVSWPNESLVGVGTGFEPVLLAGKASVLAT